MPESLVISTGPIVALCLAGATEFVGRLPFTFLVPTEVASEIAAGQKLGYRVAMPEWVSVVALAQPVGALGQSTLDAGEAAVIELALHRRINLVAIGGPRAPSRVCGRPHRDWRSWLDWQGEGMWTRGGGGALRGGYANPRRVSGRRPCAALSCRHGRGTSLRVEGLGRMDTRTGALQPNWTRAGSRGGFADHLISQVGVAKGCREAITFDAPFAKAAKVSKLG